LQRLGLSYNFTQREIQEFEILCLKILNYNLLESSSFTLLNLILNNGILSKDESNAKNPENLDLLYKIIFQINSVFVTDNRYVDFSNLQISISIISFACKILNYVSWKEKIYMFYFSKNLENQACYFVIDRYFNNLKQKYFLIDIFYSNLFNEDSF
jgi:hypothetical protein